MSKNLINPVEFSDFVTPFSAPRAPRAGSDETFIRSDETFIDETFIDETFIDETFINEGFIEPDETFIAETFIDEGNVRPNLHKGTRI